MAKKLKFDFKKVLAEKGEKIGFYIAGGLLEPVPERRFGREDVASAFDGSELAFISHCMVCARKRGLIYSVIVTLDKSKLDVDGVQESLTAGMAASVDIRTGTRRVIEYVLSPLAEHAHESLHER